LVIIFITVSVLFFTLFAHNFVTGLFSRGQDDSVLEYAYAIDKRGNIYYVRSEGEKRFLLSLDSSGNQNYKKDITSFTGTNSIIDNIYITQDNTLVLTGYLLDTATSRINGAKLFLFRDDGSFAAEVFSTELNIIYDSKYRVISSLSDDDNKICFSLLRGMALELYTVGKGGDLKARLSGSIPVGDITSQLNAFLALPSGDVILSLNKGMLVKKSGKRQDATFLITESSGAIIDNFWYAGKHFYCRDAVNGDLYASSTGETDLMAVVKGEKMVSGSENISFRQLSQVAVGSIGNLAGVLKTDSGDRIFKGNFDYLTEVAQTKASSRSGLMTWFLAAALLAGIIIITLLIWDFYCSFMRLQMSLLFRQAFLVIFVIYISFYVLTEAIIVPKSKQMLTEVHLEDQIKSAQLLVESSRTFLIDPVTKEIDPTACEKYFADFRRDGSAATRIYLLMEKNNRQSVVFSSERYESGYPAALALGYAEKLSESIRAAQTGTASLTIMTQEGSQECILLPSGMSYSGEPVIFAGVTSLSNLNQNTLSMTNTVVLYMRIIGLVLALLVVLVEILTALNIKKLKKGVDKIAAGDYRCRLDVHSGDEIEDLAKSVTALAQHILKVTKSLSRLNNSYYRFVPQRFLEMIGERHIEDAGKNSQAYKENVVLLYLRLNFLTNSAQNSEEIFSNLNSVFEKIVPVVNENQGTVYNFLTVGFNAVFESEPEKVLTVAFRIREVLSSLNCVRNKLGKSEVDIRIFITTGNIMLGFIGDESRMEPAAISDTLRKAEWILHLCFNSDIYICCTRDILESLPPEAYRNRRIGEVAVHGGVVEIFDFYDSDPYVLLKNKELYASKFDQGVTLFAEGRYKEALTIFMDIIKCFSGDGVTRNYMFLAEKNLFAEEKQRTYMTIAEYEKTHSK